MCTVQPFCCIVFSLRSSDSVHVYTHGREQPQLEREKAIVQERQAEKTTPWEDGTFKGVCSKS